MPKKNRLKGFNVFIKFVLNFNAVFVNVDESKKCGKDQSHSMLETMIL